MLSESTVLKPIAKRQPYNVKFGNVDSTRGTNLIDPPIELTDYYYWMRDDSRTNKDVIEHLNKENEFTDKVMEKHSELKDKIYNELKSYVQETYDSYPLPGGDGGWESEYYYFVRMIEGKSYPIHCRVNQKTGVEEVLLDEEGNVIETSQAP